MSGSRSAGCFALVAGGQAAPLYVSEQDWPGVQRTLRDVQADILRVTGREPLLLTDAPAPGQLPVLVGTLGRSPLLDKLVRAGRFDAALLRGRWEKFVTQVVEHPLPGVARALVVAGSDQRGTIYGLYELSAQLGVSPWYWWADVPALPRRALYVAAGAHTLGEPAVRYRGLELTAEAPTLAAWAQARPGGTPAATERLAELVLRLRGNYLWPGALATDPATLAQLEAYGLETPQPSAILSATCRYQPTAGPPAPWPALPPASASRWLLSASSFKERELALSYFFDRAWNPASAAPAAYLPGWVARQFGPALAGTIAGLLAPPPPAATPREAAAEAAARLARAEALGRHLPAADQAAYFELVSYPLAQAALRAELAYATLRQHEAQAQGHAVRAAEQSAQVDRLLARAETWRSHYHALLGGKWKGILPLAQLTAPVAATLPPPAEAQAYGR